MKFRSMRKSVLAFAILGGIFTDIASAGDLIREQKSILIDGHREVWQLVWRGKPGSVCGLDDLEIANTCPCIGFAYGQVGKLELVRRSDGRIVEHFPLNPYFADQDVPISDGGEGGAVLSRWPTRNDDTRRAAEGDSSLEKEIRRRAAPDVMQFADYNHDGRASEFLMQVGEMPCGKRIMVAVGVSAANGKLHVFTSLDNPGKPLELPSYVWSALLKSSKPTKVTVWPCGDHASEVEDSVSIYAKNGGIHTNFTEKQCAPEAVP